MGIWSCLRFLKTFTKIRELLLQFQWWHLNLKILTFGEFSPKKNVGSQFCWNHAVAQIWPFSAYVWITSIRSMCKNFTKSIQAMSNQRKLLPSTDQWCCLPCLLSDNNAAEGNMCTISKSFYAMAMVSSWRDLLEGEVGAGAGIGMGMGIAVAPAPPLEPGWLVTGSLSGSWGSGSNSKWVWGLGSVPV